VPVRLIDAGVVPHLRSQTLYHGLAYARDERAPDTVVLATPGEPYVCIGFHQDAGHELDLAFCAEQGLPVVRRETGGGAVLIDSDQLFVQWIMGPARLPPRPEDRFELFARPLVATYRDFGIEARFRPINDIHVNGRKITGTGAARIGEAEVVVGNFLFDFDTGLMAQILRAPSQAFRRQVDRSLQSYMTTMKAELQSVPEVAEVAARYRRHCADALGAELAPGELTAAEIDAIERVEQRFRSNDFVYQPGGLRRRGVKIHEDVYVAESDDHDDAGTRRVTASLREGRIVDIALDAGRGNGDLSRLENALRGVDLRPEPVTRALRQNSPPGFDVDAWARTILALASPPRADRP